MDYNFPDCLLLELLAEQGLETAIPATQGEKRRLLRQLMNIRPPGKLSPELLALQDMELSRQREEKGIVNLGQIPVLESFPRIRLWQGDITRLRVDAIVNAANSKMLGCFQPLHNCIDNAIHSAAGMQLREECHQIMQRQGHDERPGQAKISGGYNLPARYVIHTVGPIVNGARPTSEDRRLLSSSYRSCLSLASENRLRSLAFCCISTGVYGYPGSLAAQCALATVLDFLENQPASTLENIIFNVFKDEDFQIYQKLLQAKP